MRTILAVLVMTFPLLAQTPPNQNFAPPSPFTPDDATLKTIKEKSAELATEVEKLKEIAGKSGALLDFHRYADVAVYHKAAEWIVRHNEWYTKDSGKQTITVLVAGLARAQDALAGKEPWRSVRGKPVARGYVSGVDGSLQPFSVNFPPGFGTDGKKYRVDVVLHGRDATLTEVKFLAAREGTKSKPVENVTIDVYGRGNNAYRWSGETDVRDVPFVALSDDENKHILETLVVRGFSMGGAGTWHFGLHQPFYYSAMAPGAGFTVTRGYVKNLPDKLPDYIERCLRIYDAADYAENLVNIPCVAYSGEKDPQIAAVKNIEARLKQFDGKPLLTHFIAPGLEHKQPPEWVAKIDEQLKTDIANRKLPPNKVHFVTNTPEYSHFGLGLLSGQETPYAKTVIDAVNENGVITLKTVNARAIFITERPLTSIVIDGQKVMLNPDMSSSFVKTDGQWKSESFNSSPVKPIKNGTVHGPIDAAFMSTFAVAPTSGTAWYAAVDAVTAAQRKQFAHLWDKYFRGALPVLSDDPAKSEVNVVYFGDPGNNPGLAKILPKLPIKWTDSTLEVNGRTYDPKTHYPVLIYPHPEKKHNYVVLNSGHTFGEADLKGTNALLYPRLGDWAVMKLAPTKADPHAVEVVDAGIFDSNWQYEKK